MKKTFFTSLILCTMSISMFAHGSHGSGFIAGFTHPIFGLDHLLAIMTLGLLIASLGFKSSLPIALAFIVSMGISGWMGINTDGFPYMESGIAISIVLLGIAMLLNVSIPVFVGIIGSVIIAFFHGYAHGVEMPESTSPFLYISGFLFGALLIFAISIAIGNFISQFKSKNLILQLIGVTIAGSGLLVLLS